MRQAELLSKLAANEAEDKAREAALQALLRQNEEEDRKREADLKLLLAQVIGRLGSWEQVDR